MGPSPSPKRGRSAHVYCGQTAGLIKVALGMEVGLGPGHIVLNRDPATPPVNGQSPNFWPISVVAKRLDGLRCHLVWRQASAQATLCSMGTQLPPEKRIHPLHTILAHVYCGQTAGWMKTPLGTEIDLGLAQATLY